MIRRLLIANRGEIACRIIRSAKALGIETVSIFSDADRHAQHVLQADFAYPLHGTASTDTYLNWEKIIALAQQHAVDAIHPGYGFLSENSEFAQRCAEAKLIFVGPTAAAIQAMGDKALAKQLMQRAQVPTIPGYEGDEQSDATLQQAAATIGFPVLIKAAGGGGGKGMRLCQHPNTFLTDLYSAQQEAQASFHNQRVILEKYLPNARHVEIQIFADQHGHVLYLFSRDCSIQRRHQKIVEEAPAPNLPAALLARMGDTAVQAAKAIDYQGAGTIEFLVDAEQQFYFMEMNTRLQVEHPVTEQITGLDLVAWQLKVAAGQALPCSQAELTCNGHAIEVRVCAENPAKNFMPASGRLSLVHFPQAPGIRVDSGVITGDSIPPYYDSLIAKIIAHGPSRAAAIERLQHALQHTYLAGVDTNIGYLQAILHTEAFKQGELSTEFIQHRQAALKLPNSLPNSVCAFAVLAEHVNRQQAAFQLQQQAADPNSPWLLRDYWRLNHPNDETLVFWWESQPVSITYRREHDQFLLKHGSEWIPFALLAQDGLQISMQWEEQHLQAGFAADDQSLSLFVAGHPYVLARRQPINLQRALRPNQKVLLAPLPSTVVELMVAPGQQVAEGESLLVLEAMKMQNTVTAPAAGTIKHVYPKVGDLLAEGAALIEFD